MKFQNVKRIILPGISEATAINPEGKRLVLNMNDISLLIFCSDEERWLSQIARELGISVKNVSVRLERLKEFGLIAIDSTVGYRKRKYIKTLIKIPEDWRIKK